jgi:hypothetical protein
MPAPKVGKDGHPVFDKNQGYKGPDRITAIMWIIADCNVKDTLSLIQMELKGEKLQLCWKLAQKKNSHNQIVIYGLVPGFDPKGIMRELLYGLKKSKKNYAMPRKFSLSENIDRQERALPLFNGYFKQATAPKASSHSESQETLLNKSREYMQNGCRLFHLK